MADCSKLFFSSLPAPAEQLFDIAAFKVHQDRTVISFLTRHRPT
jgi:hypothetical protein